jgi:hypothetical protein
MMGLPFQVLRSRGTNTAHPISFDAFALDRAIARRRR